MADKGVVMGDPATELAEVMGLRTPVPSRHGEMPDDLLEEYVYGLRDAIRRKVCTSTQATDMVCAVNEFLKARHRYLFDAFEECYYEVPTIHFRSQVFFSLERLAGSRGELLDRMLEMYMTDHRSIGSTNEMIKEYFQTMVVKKGKQRHWDLIAQSVDTRKDVEFLTMLTSKFQAKLDRRGVVAWMPELDDAQRVVGGPPTRVEDK